MPELWLPPATQLEMLRTIRGGVNLWFADWVDTDNLQILACSPELSGAVQDFGSGTITYCEKDCINLGLDAITGQADPANLADRAILAKIGSAIVEDICEKIRLVGLKSGRSESGTKTWRISRNVPEWSIVLTLTDEVIIALRLKLSGEGRRPALVPLAKAFEDIPVKLGCHIGEVTIVAAELSALTVGDLLVFPKRSDEMVPISIDGQVAARGIASILRPVDDLVVKLEHSISLAKKEI